MQMSILLTLKVDSTVMFSCNARWVLVYKVLSLCRGGGGGGGDVCPGNPVVPVPTLDPWPKTGEL